MRLELECGGVFQWRQPLLLFVGRAHRWTTGDTKPLVDGIPTMNRFLSAGVTFQTQ